MKYEDLKKFEEKRVVILLKNNYKYSGKVLFVRGDSLVLNDKYKQDIIISFDNIASIMEFFNMGEIKK